MHRTKPLPGNGILVMVIIQHSKIRFIHILSAGKYTVTLTINSGADTEIKTDYIHVLPYGGTPYNPSDGGNFETNLNDFASENLSGTAFELGNSSVTGKQRNT